jgi:hypothetical protein
MLTRRIITLALSLLTTLGIAAGTVGTASAATRHNPPPAATRYHSPAAGTRHNPPAAGTRHNPPGGGTRHNRTA